MGRLDNYPKMMQQFSDTFRLNLSGLIFSAVVALVAGCSSTRYYFAPKSADPLTPGRAFTTTLAVPGGQTKSFIRIFPTGIRKNHGRMILPVSFYLENSGFSSWHLDASHQRVKLPGVDAPVVGVISDEPYRTPVIDVPKGESRVWDIVFPVPESMKTSLDLAGFDLSWEVVVQAKPMTGTTSFVRAILPDDKSISTGGSSPSAKKSGRH